MVTLPLVCCFLQCRGHPFWCFETLCSSHQKNEAKRDDMSGVLKNMHISLNYINKLCCEVKDWGWITKYWNQTVLNVGNWCDKHTKYVPNIVVCMHLNCDIAFMSWFISTDVWRYITHTFLRNKSSFIVSWVLETSRVMSRVGTSTCWPSLHRNCLTSRLEDSCYLMLWNSTIGCTQILVSLQMLPKLLVEILYTYRWFWLSPTVIIHFYMCTSIPGDQGTCSKTYNWTSDKAGSAKI